MPKENKINLYLDNTIYNIETLKVMQKAIKNRDTALYTQLGHIIDTMQYKSKNK